MRGWNGRTSASHATSARRLARSAISVAVAVRGEAGASESPRPGPSIAIVLPPEAEPGGQLASAYVEPRRLTNGSRLVTGSREWLTNTRRPASIARSAFVHGQANIIGRVVLGDHVHIAANASVRADEGAPFFIGNSTNVQDGVVIHALKDRYVLVHGERWAVYVGKNVSIAHDALVHGPCFIGVVVGVELPEERYVPPGSVIVGARCFVGIGDAHWSSRSNLTYTFSCACSLGATPRCSRSRSTTTFAAAPSTRRC